MRGVYYVQNPQGKLIPMVHISRFSAIVGLTIPTARNLILREPVEQWDKRRPLKVFRDGSTIWVPLAEVTGYPFHKGDRVYHFTEDGERVLCEQCSFNTEPCDKNKQALDIELPKDL